MSDVARQAGVSIKTVSRVINKVPTVDPAIAQRVLEASAALGFRRNDLARGLRSGRNAASIGLVIEDLANPFYSTIASAVEAIAAQRDSLLITASSEENADRERRFVLAMCERRVDGIILVPAGADHQYLRSEIELGTPIVFLDRPPVGLRADTVLIDNKGGAKSGIAYLLERGHRRIGLLVDSLAIWTMRERLAGAQAALQKAGVRQEEIMTRCDLHEPEMTAKAVADMLASRRPPTAFFCANNRTAIGAVLELHRRRSDAALVGFDDFELSQLMPRPLTIIGYDVEQLGRKAAELLFRRIAGETFRPTTITVPTYCVQRGTMFETERV